MENWKKVIEEQRTQFDKVEEVPHEAIWQGINSKLDRRSSPINMWLGIAATLTIVFVAGMLMQQQRTNHITAQQMDADWQTIDWEAEENRLVGLVELKKNEIGFDSISVQDYPTLFQELESGEDQFTELLADREIYPNNEALLKVLIKYHERQLHLLERLARENKRKRDSA